MGKKGKHKKASDHKKRKKSKPSSSSDDSSGSDEWVEQTTDSSTLVSKEEPLPAKLSHDGWSTNACIFSGVTREELQQSKEKKKSQTDSKQYMLDTLGQTERELNPYWKDGGSGLPSENPVTADTLQQATVTVGDQGVAWLRRALQRAMEQAADQRRPLREVVAERWGSLEKLESMIAAAEERENKSKYRKYDKEKYKSDRKSDKDRNSSRREEYKDSNHHEDKRSLDRTYSRESRKRDSFKSQHNKPIPEVRKSFAKPQDSSDDSSDEMQRNNHNKSVTKSSKRYESKFARPSNSSSDDTQYGHKKKDNLKHGRNKDKSYKHNNESGRFKKSRSSSSCSSSDTSSSEDERRVSKGGSRKYKRSRSKELMFSKTKLDSEENRPGYPISGKGWKKRTESIDKKGTPEVVIKELEPGKSEKEIVTEMEKTPAVEELVLTDKEMNDLAAKLVKAELLGNESLAKELKEKLQRARETKSTRTRKVEAKEEVVILTHTDAKGFTRPVSLGAPETSRDRRKPKKVETHSGGKRTRYFADDDKYNLQEMFQREKLSTVEDSNEVFAKLASKIGNRQDMDDVFEETACIKESDGKKQAKMKQQAISESKRVARSLNNCQWCLESKEMLKHLIVAIGTQCYLCVPPYQSLTDNHCLIVPSHHSACGTQLDEDVWAEVQEFRKCLVKMFLSQDEDVLFFESARQLNKFPHMVLNCVPVPKETGDMAPIYFKKAIQECEMEWSNNKKLVDLRGRDVRRAIPKGLPYFTVDFGMDSGFAHVIENEQLFPQNFAQEIIGGMLDLDHTIWRKQKRQTFEEQSKKVIALTKLWSSFDLVTQKK